jgi:hypothetical protein
VADATRALIEDGWEQIRAGLELIVWSHLALWNPDELRLIVTTSELFKSHATHVHPERSRLLCWISFSVGCEYIVKGIFALNGNPLIKRSLGHPFDWGAVLTGDADPRFVKRTIHLLNEQIRNPDLHRFKRYVRKSDFPKLEGVVRAMNMIVGSVDQSKLRQTQAKIIKRRLM